MVERRGPLLKGAPMLATPEFPCADCGGDVTRLAPTEHQYGGFVRTDDGLYHHSRCIYERERDHAEERYAAAITRPTPAQREAFRRWARA